MLCPRGPKVWYRAQGSTVPGLSQVVTVAPGPSWATVGRGFFPRITYLAVIAKPGAAVQARSPEGSQNWVGGTV